MIGIVRQNYNSNYLVYTNADYSAKTNDSNNYYSEAYNINSDTIPITTTLLPMTKATSILTTTSPVNDLRTQNEELEYYDQSQTNTEFLL